MRCGRESPSKFGEETDVREDSAGSAAVEGEGGLGGDSVISPICDRSRPRPVVLCGAGFSSDGFATPLAGSERRDLFEGVDGVARPSQRTDRFEGVLEVEAGVTTAEAGLGK